MWRWIRRLLRAEQPPATYLRRVEDKPPPGVKVDRSDPYRRKGWVNFLLPKELVDYLGETSTKDGVSPRVAVRALFELFASWPEPTRKKFCWECLLRGVEDVDGGPIEDVHLPPDPPEISREEQKEMKANLRVEQLEKRDCPAVALPSVSLSAGVLTVNGTDGNDTILVTDAGEFRDIDIFINGKQYDPPTGPAQFEQVSQIVINGLGGDDDIRTDASLDTLNDAGQRIASPFVSVFGGDGDDFINIQNGGPAAGIQLVNGVLTGPFVGGEYVDGGAGNDTLIDGPANGGVFLGGMGDDLYVWPPGTLDAVVDLGVGNDTVRIIGNDGANDAFSLMASNGRVIFQRTNLVNFTVDSDNVERFELLPGSGDDTVKVGKLDGTDAKSVFIDGGAGADDIQVAKQKRVMVSVAPDPMDTVNLDAVFAEMGGGGGGGGGNGKGRR